MINKERNISIQVLRVVAMFLIIADHTLIHIDFPFKSVIAQITNSGVLIFLFISGFLYGQKEIDNWKKWFANRIIRIMIPIWVFMIIDLLLEYFVWHRFFIKNVFVYLFDVQGIFGTTMSTTQLWFMTLIMICYILTPFLCLIKKQKWSKITILVSCLTVIVVHILLSLTVNNGMIFNHPIGWCFLAIVIYAIGFFAGNKILNDKLSGKIIIVIVLITALVSMAVITLKNRFDGTVWYNFIVFWYGIVCVDLSICVICYKLGMLKWIKKCKRIIDFLDKYSFEIYIVHCLIIEMLTKPMVKYIGNIGYIVLTIVISIVSAVLLKTICIPLQRNAKKILIKE